VETGFVRRSKNFYAAVVKRDLASARAYLADDMVFEGVFQIYRSADEYMKTFAGLLQITVRLDVKKIIGEGNNAAVFFGTGDQGASPSDGLSG
jgi:hypothetical protein